MNRSLIVTCPCCNTELDIDVQTGKIIRHGPKPAALPSGKADTSRFDAALQNVKKRPGQAQSAFERARDALRDRESKLDSAFRDSVRKVQETDDGSRPLNPLDMD